METCFCRRIINGAVKREKKLKQSQLLLLGHSTLRLLIEQSFFFLLLCFFAVVVSMIVSISRHLVEHLGVYAQTFFVIAHPCLRLSILRSNAAKARRREEADVEEHTAIERMFAVVVLHRYYIGILAEDVNYYERVCWLPF